MLMSVSQAAAELRTVEALELRVAELEALLVGKSRRTHVKAKPPITPIVADAAEQTGFSVAEILSPRRTEALTRVRFAVYWAAREATGRSFPIIGAAIGGRDHSTVLSGLGRAETLRADLPAFRALTDLLVEQARARQSQETPPCQPQPPVPPCSTLPRSSAAC